MDLDHKWRWSELELWHCTSGYSRRECILSGTVECMWSPTQLCHHSALCSHFFVDSLPLAMRMDLGCKSSCQARAFPGCRTKLTSMKYSQEHIEWYNCHLTKWLCPLCSSELLHSQCHLELRKDLLCTWRFPQQSGQGLQMQRNWKLYVGIVAKQNVVSLRFHPTPAVITCHHRTTTTLLI